MLLWPRQTPDDARLNLDAPLVTDRPNFTDAASTVGRGVSQIEFGYTYSHRNANAAATNAHAYPEASLRYGVLTDWLELRLGQSLLTHDTGDDSSTDFGNTYLGTKLGLVPQYSLLPQIAIQPQMTLPTGSGDSRTEHVLPGLNVVLLWSVSEKSYLTGSSKVNRSEASDASGVSTTWAQSAVIGMQVTPYLSCYLEWFGIFQDSVTDANDSHFADTGITYVYTKDIQFDLRFGTGLQNTFGEELFAGAGMSVRFL